MKLYIGADHNGYDYKRQIASFLTMSGHEVVDIGSDTLDPADDFPQFAGHLVQALRADADPEAKGLLVCGSGQGMAMAANRCKGIRASLCWNTSEARASRNDDDANVLCLSARYLEIHDTEAIITTWLATPFAGAPRFVRRIKELDALA
jgi:ribose 5-phosphate isomerase B